MERTLSKARLTGGERERAVAHASRTSVLVSGANEHGALCLPHTDAVEVPTRLLALRSQFVRCVGAGDGWSVCGTSAGLLAAWGAGELPLPIGHISSGCTTLACDGSRVHFLTDEGEVFSWIFSTEHLAPPPQRVALPTDIHQIACGAEHVLALSDGGSVFSWGHGSEGQLGRPLPAGSGGTDPSPRRVDGLPPAGIVSIACGGAHSMLLTPSGELLGCGPTSVLAGAAPVLGAPRFVEIAGPWQGEEPAGLSAVACGRAHTLALSQGGKLYSFGEGANGQLGHGGGGGGGGGRAARPMRVGGALATNVVERVWASPLCDVSFASARIAVATDRWSATDSGGDGDDGGDGGDGGDGSDKPTETLASFMWGTLPSAAAGAVVRTPEEILELRGQALMQMVAAPAHCLALLAAGDVYAWGSDAFGGSSGAGGRAGATGLQLLGPQPSLLHHAALDRHRVTSLACGDGPHVLGLTAASEGGRVIVWGRNERAELGIGQGELATCAPRLLTSGALAGRKEPLLHIAAGAHFSLACGRRADDIFGWGENARQQLGRPAPRRSCCVVGGEAVDEMTGDGEGADGLIWTPRRLAPVGPPDALVTLLTAGFQHAGALLMPADATAAASGAAAGTLGAVVGTTGAVVGGGVLWGAGDFGALGRGGGDVADHADAAPCHHGSLSGGREALLSHLSCGRETSAAIDVHGQVHLWGRFWGAAGAARPVTEARALSMSELERAVLGGPLSGGRLAVRSLCCSGRRILIALGHCAGVAPLHTPLADPSAMVVCSAQFGGALAPLRALEGLAVCSMQASADTALLTTLDGRCFEVSLGGVREADGTTVEEVALPPGVRAIGVAAGRTQCAVLVVGALTAAETARPPSAVTGASGNLPRHGAGVAMTPMGTTATDPELEARFQQSLTLGGSRPGTAGSRPGTAGSRPCWLE